MTSRSVRSWSGLLFVAVAAIMLAGTQALAQKTSAKELQQKKAELEEQRDALQQKRAELEKERQAAQAKLTARQAELDKEKDIQELRSAVTDARAAADKFIKTDADLATLRKARDDAQRAVDPLRHKVLGTTDEAKALGKERNDIALKDTLLDFQSREADFIMQRKVVPRVYRENKELSAATAKRDSLWRQMDQARRSAESESKELQALRDESSKLRNAYYKASGAAKPEELGELYKLRAEKEAAYRKISADKLKEADKALAEARRHAEEVRRERTNADKEASSLQSVLADLRKDKAEIEYQIALNEFRLRDGVSRRIGFDPEVRKAEGERWRAENARRQKENSDPDIAAARKEYNDARNKVGALENKARHAPEVAAAEKAWRAKEHEYNQLRGKLHQEATAELQVAHSEAAKVAQSLHAKALTADEEVEELNKEKVAVAEDREAGRKRRGEIDTEWRKLFDQTLEDEEVKNARQAAVEAKKAYDDGYAASEAPKLLQAVKDAQKMLNQKTAEMRQGDEVCAALGTQLGELGQKARELDGQIRSAAKDIEDVSFQIITLGLKPADARKKDLVNGLVLKCYEPKTSPDADFPKKGEPAKVVKAEIVDHSLRTRDENFGLVFEGFVEIPEAGDYTFHLASDDGSYLSLAGMQIIDNGGSHGVVEKSRKLSLEAGIYELGVKFYQGTGAYSLSLHWTGPEIEKQVVPASTLYALKKDLPEESEEQEE